MPYYNQRITPAGAGKTVKLAVGTHNGQGSPPQVRGKLPQLIVGIVKGRITPAGAGKTAPARAQTCRRWDHPRRCGENFAVITISVFVLGSPPQVRGKPAHGGDAVGYNGITPAGAGKTQFAANPADMCQDHPRRCGENPCNVGGQKLR